MERPAEDKFCIFISHKHEDHALAMAVRDALHRLGGGRIECFVSGVDIAAGADWNRQIKSRLAQSHLLILLFTSPSRELGLVPLRSGVVHTLRRRGRLRHRLPVQSGNRLAATPGQPAGCRRGDRRPSRSSSASSAGRRGASRTTGDGGRSRPTSTTTLVASAANEIVAAFPKASFAERSHYACHRVVLDLTAVDEIGEIIPESARVVEGDGATSGFTLSLFNRADGRRALCWRDLIDAVDGVDAAWRHQLDRRFVAALNEELFTPISATLRAWNQGRRHQRVFKPVLYRIVRGTRRRRTRARAAARPK